MRHKDPETLKAYMRDWRAKNREKTRAYNRDWRKANPTKHASYVMEKRYGITHEERDTLLARQGGVCAICGTSDPGAKRGWHVDHCHSTGRVRGILCPNCNVGLGNFRDQPHLLTRAIDYLKKGTK